MIVVGSDGRSAVNLEHVQRLSIRKDGHVWRLLAHFPPAPGADTYTLLGTFTTEASARNALVSLTTHRLDLMPGVTSA